MALRDVPTSEISEMLADVAETTDILRGIVSGLGTRGLSDVSLNFSKAKRFAHEVVLWARKAKVDVDDSFAQHDRNQRAKETATRLHENKVKQQQSEKNLGPKSNRKSNEK